MALKIIDRDLGLNKILSELKKVQGSYVSVGILEDAPPPAKGQMSMAKLGTIHEYGLMSLNIPARPFMRQTFERINAKISELIKNQLDLVIKGSSNVKRSLGLVGEYVRSEIRRQFVVGDFEPNKPSTIKAKTVGGKKGTTPLIDTGRLRASINYKVTIK